MRAEILCVGSELLLGQIIDTNAAYMATQLARAGIDLHRKQTVGDNLERITDCIRGALSHSDALIITGGLGPTTDDLTREAIAGALGVELEYHAELEQGLRDFFSQRDIVPTATIMRQAYLPAGAVAIPNPVGTAPGVRAETGNGGLIFAVPGVPREMRAMIDESVIPALLERLEGERSVIISRVLRAFGIGESALAEPLEDILTTSQNPTVAPLIYGSTEVHLRLTAKARDESEAQAVLDGMETQIRERVGEHIFGSDEESLPSVVVGYLAARGFSVAVAESVTGGVVNSLLTDVPGASKVLRGGVVAYSPSVKVEILGVPREVIKEHGVVSGATAAAMAEGVRRVCSTQIGIATTGEAGPQAGTDAPVGTVFIGLSDGGTVLTFERRFFGDREIIRKRAALSAIDILRRHLLDLPQIGQL